MDAKTRGHIEKMIDELVEEFEVAPIIQWLKQLLPIKSLEDAVFGYKIGEILAFARAGVFYLILISGSISKKELIRRYAPEGEVPEEDKNEIIKMVERRIPQIREKIAREFGR